VSAALCREINFQKKRIGETAEAFNKAILRAALEAIPFCARKDYKPYWIQKLGRASHSGTWERRRKTVLWGKHRIQIHLCKIQALNASVRDSWVKNTESLNLDRDGQLWRLAQVLNNEDCRTKETTIQVSGKVVTGNNVATIFVDIFAQVSQIPIPPAREQEVFCRNRGINGCSNSSRGEYVKQPDNERDRNGHPLSQTKKFTEPRRCYKLYDQKTKAGSKSCPP
jgi:hypothetical protein